jgi:hypothetical protein
MKKILALGALICSLNSMAASYDMNCTATHNMDKVIETRVTVQDGDRNKAFGEYENFRFFVTAAGNNTVEVQSFDSSTPSRTYATSKMSEKGNFVELSIWTRDYLLEVRCTLN